MRAEEEINKEIDELNREKDNFNSKSYNINKKIDELKYERYSLYKTTELVQYLDEMLKQNLVYEKDNEYLFIQSYCFTKDALYLKGIRLYFGDCGRISLGKDERYIQLSQYTIEFLKENIKSIKDSKIEFPFDFNTFVVDYIGGL